MLHHGKCKNALILKFCTTHRQSVAVQPEVFMFDVFCNLRAIFKRLFYSENL